MKLCPKCSKLKDETKFCKNRTKNDRLSTWCRECTKEYNVIHRNDRHKYYVINREKILKYQKDYKYTHGMQPMSKKKDCSCFLGIYVAEGLVSKYFKNPIRMPRNNPGYDFVCSNGFKIDVKSSVLTKNNGWEFNILENKTANYFLCLAYDTRIDINLRHVWLFPCAVVNHMRVISSTQSRIAKWSQYEQPIGDMKVCCDTLKDKSNE